MANDYSHSYEHTWRRSAVLEGRYYDRVSNNLIERIIELKKQEYGNHYTDQRDNAIYWFNGNTALSCTDENGIEINMTEEQKDRVYANILLEEMDDVLIGKTKIDNTKRISLISDIIKMLNASPGEEVEYYIRGDAIIIKKKTEPYKGYDIENDIVTENIQTYKANVLAESIAEKIDKSTDKREDYEKVRKEYEQMRKNQSV